MPRDVDLEQIKGLIHRHGEIDPPAADSLMPEVRSNDVIPIRPRPAAIDYVLGAIVVEWTFGVPYKAAANFHAFLRDNEKMIATAVKTHVQGAQYLGTYWSVGYGPSVYRTLWSYETEAAMKQLDDFLNESNNVFNAVKTLREFWANDPSRQEMQYQPAAVITDLQSGVNAFVKMINP
jgi:hypothetical protein